MTQEEKQLLLKDLCARLPYGVKILHRDSVEEIAEISPEGYFKNRNYNTWFNIETCKPYLRPMSSMTKEEKYTYRHMLGAQLNSEGESIMFVYIEDFPVVIDWLNARPFDYRGLIPMGLALEAPEEMYKTE